ncbi:MAG: LysM peptidoglycan-binding domain-containing protein [Chloroflexi bacterium]|nr:LysM peptidoglycan-binding domain-containing protein [Chloroflexota bacterium]
MTFKKLIACVGLVAVIAATIGLAPLATVAAPLRQSNLLQNPGMEQPYQGCGSGNTASGWGCWYTEIAKPDDASGLQYSAKAYFISETNAKLVRSGSVSQHMGYQIDPWIGGLKQTVTVPANAQLRFCAWSQLFANNTPYGKEPSVSFYEGRSRVGIFPNGEANGNTPGIAWSGAINPHNDWQQVCVTVTAGPQGKVTVLTSNDYRGYAATHLDAWWDDAELVVVGEAPTPQPTAGSTQPQPTTPAQPLPTAAPPVTNADGSVVHTIVSGDTLFGLSIQYNVTLDEILTLNGLTKDSILSIGQKITIKGGTGASSAQPTAAPTAAPGQPVDPAQATPAQPAEATPAVPAQPTPAQPSSAAKLCVRAYSDANSDGLLTAGEEPVAGVQFAVANSQGVQAAAYTTDAAGEEHCFTDLPPGSYTVAVQPAPGTVATSDKRWGVALTGGSVVNINFGSRSDGTAPTNPQPGQAEATPAANGSGSGLGGLLTGAVGLIVLLVAGVLGAFVIARRRA